MAVSEVYAARETSATAAANELVLNGQTAPATTIQFVSNGPDGDLRLDSNGGLPDPNTLVSVGGGAAQSFTYTVVGSFTVGDTKVPSALWGKQVIKIVLADGTILFFVRDPFVTVGLLDSMANGNIKLTGITQTPPPTYPCFCAGTEIATPSGNRKVETLVAGDFLLNDRGEAKQLLWVGRSEIPAAELRAHPDLRPIRITAGAIAPSCPSTDLDVSPQHRIVLEGPKAELLFGEERVLATARHLVGALAEVVTADADVTYYHLLLEDHEILVSNGLATESFQPARRMIEAMTGENRELLEKTLQALGMTEMLSRKDALRALKAGEAMLLAKAIRDGAAPEGTALGTSSGTLAAVA
ncbi:Hint domain-containing protein [Ostreiculturibacter nitratireducens]|uniref:Hint domain-containing protein n=1 Tax=Ostreiculturibacter nitratireducens TaxID=3075226 RepID=UPI0031B5D077